MVPRGGTKSVNAFNLSGEKRKEKKKKKKRRYTPIDPREIKERPFSPKRDERKKKRGKKKVSPPPPKKKQKKKKKIEYRKKGKARGAPTISSSNQIRLEREGGKCLPRSTITNPHRD